VSGAPEALACRHLPQLGDDVIAFAYANSAFERGQAEGSFPSDRPGPTGGEQCVLLVRGDEIIGCATFYDVYGDSGTCWLDLLFVEPSMRHRGRARALITGVKDQAQLQGIASVKFGTGTSNKTMHIIAAQMGFATEHVVYAQPIETLP